MAGAEKQKDTAARLRAVQGRRASNAAGTHADRRTKRERSRAAQDRAAINRSDRET